VSERDALCRELADRAWRTTWTASSYMIELGKLFAEAYAAGERAERERLAVLFDEAEPGQWWNYEVADTIRDRDLGAGRTVSARTDAPAGDAATTATRQGDGE
jgi:hypothetical protein